MVSRFGFSGMRNDLPPSLCLSLSFGDLASHPSCVPGQFQASERSGRNSRQLR